MSRQSEKDVSKISMRMPDSKESKIQAFNTSNYNKITANACLENKKDDIVVISFGGNTNNNYN